MKNLNYGLVVGTIRVLETRLLGQTHFLKLQECESVEQFADELKSLNYDVGSFFSVDEFRHCLAIKFSNILKSLIELSPGNAPFNVLFLYNDFFNLRTIMFANFFKFSFEKLILKPNFLPIDLIKSCVLANNFEDMPCYFKNFAQQLGLMLQRGVDRAEILNFSNTYMFEQKLQISSFSEFLVDRTRLEIDIYNCKMVLRTLKMQFDEKNLKDKLISGGFCDVESFVNAFENGNSGLSRLFNFQFGLNFEELFKNFNLVDDVFYLKIADFNFKRKILPFGFAPIVSYLDDLNREHKILQKILINIVFKVDGFK